MAMSHQLRSLQAPISHPSPPSQPTTVPHHHLHLPSPPTSPCKLSRRALAAAAASLPFLHFPLPLALADDHPNTDDCTNPPTTTTSFLDVSIAGTPAGRITIALSPTAPLGAARFSSLVSGAAGLTYRRKEFVKITPSYVQHVGVRSYGVDAELARRTGGELAADSLVAEWAAAAEKKCGGMKRGAVGIIVRNPARPPPKLKLVARSGKLVVDEEEVGEEPNGTEFVIAVRDSPELDASTLVVGRVVGGMEVVERMAEVKTVQENSSSPYFRVAKLIGDKRAVVAERGFNSFLKYNNLYSNLWNSL